MKLFRLKIGILACILMISGISFTNTEEVTETGTNTKISEGKQEEAEKETVERLTKYSQRDDGYIDLKSVLHEETPDFRITDGNNVRLLLRTKK